MSDSENEQTEAGAVAEIVRASALPIFKQPADHGTSAPLLVDPRSCEVVSLEKYLPAPVRKRATVMVRDHDSFIAYVELHREAGTALFGNLDTHGANFTAVIDYHRSNGGDLKAGAPAWGEHRCILNLEHTPEWNAWKAADGKGMSQTEFALFLEDNRLDIVDPEAGQLIDIAKSLEATTGSKFLSAVRLENGDRKFTYESQTTARAGERGDITIPEKIKLKLPVFVNGPAFPMEAFFRYRLKDGQLVLFYNLIRPHKVIEAAVHTSRDAITAATKMLIHHGKLDRMGI